MVHILGKDLGNIVFFIPQEIGIIIFFYEYYYPERKENLNNNKDKFYSHIKELFQEERIKKYLDEFYK